MATLHETARAAKPAPQPDCVHISEVAADAADDPGRRPGPEHPPAREGGSVPLVTAEALRPRAARPPIATVSNAALTEADMMQFIVAAVDSEGLVGHNIKAFNDLINEGIPQILTELFDVTNVVKDLREQTEMDRQRESVKIHFRFTDVKVGRPVYGTHPIGRIMPLFPNEARLSGRTYAAPLTLAAEVAMTAHYADGREETKRAEIPPFMVAAIPMMVGADRCHTWNLTREARKGLQEDPNESGGYFLAKGSEWVVEWLENISFNTLHVHKRMQANERVRGEFISQPGGAFENSSQVIIRYMANASLTIEINSTKFSKTRIPFFLIFRLLGMTSDADILQQIVYDPASDSPVVRHMVDVVGRALKHEDAAYAAVHNELDREKLTEFMAVRLSKFVTNPTAYKSSEHAIQYLNDNLLGIMDRFLLPHIGRDASSRGLKLRYLGMLVHKTLLVDMGILEPTDRDSYSNKRVHGSGVSIAKAFKTQFNNSVVVPVLRALKREIRNTPFEELSVPNIIDAFKNPMASSDLGRTLEQAITSGNKTIVVRRRAVVNRVSTQTLERKNPANYYSALRAVSTHNASKASKQTERADKMRRVHASYTGYICVAKSADTGEMVGMKKELAITASVCRAGEAYPLILRLKEDPAITLADEVQTPDLIRKNLACVFVNGAWIGCCAAAHELVGRYRLLRREGRVVDPQTSIVWNPITDDVDFHLDVGRLTRPLIIVDNNIEEYDAAARAVHAGRKGAKRAEFIQNIRLTPAHIAGIRAGTLALEDLRAAGVIEWITPQEAENCLVAPSLDALRADAHNVAMRYTHCDVEQAIFGLTALVSPFGNHTQPARITYETNQGRQAGGWYSFAAPFRVDKNRFFQHYCEAPLVRTIAYNWLFPNGMNTTVAYMINAGYNQEDSAVVKKGFIQRGGFAGAFYRFEKAELEKGEFFGNPDITTTKNLKPNASYEKLVDGFVPPGTVVQKGDVLIGRIAKIQASGRRGPRGPPAAGADDGYKFVDRSVVYHLAEPAVVTDVFRPRGPNDNIFGLVKLRYHRPLSVGDKLSSRAGNKSIMALEVPETDLPYDENGETPDIIINPHCLAGEAPVTLACGLSRRIDALAAGGGERVWGWDKALGGLVAAPQCGLMPKGREAVLRITLEDGRALRATGNHPVWTLGPDGGGAWTRAEELSADPGRPSRVLVGLGGPLDEPGPDEAGWRLEAGPSGYSFAMDPPPARERSLAFARVAGFLLAGGGGAARGRFGHQLDAEAFCRDIGLIAGAGPGAGPGGAPVVNISARPAGGAGAWAVDVPAGLRRGIRALGGFMAGGKRATRRAWGWPAFVRGAPAAVVREFLAGLFGGGGSPPCLAGRPAAGGRKAKSGEGRLALKGVAISLATAERRALSLRKAMEELVHLLSRVGVVGAQSYGPVGRAAGTQHGRVRCGVRVPAGSLFAEKVGFRYCAEKASRLEAASAYWRSLEKGQARRRHHVVGRASPACGDPAAPGISLTEARDVALEGLAAAEPPPLDDHHPAPPSSAVVNRRRRPNGRKQAALKSPDHARTADPVAFFREAGCLDWFRAAGAAAGKMRTQGRAGGAGAAIPGFSLRVADVRADGEAEVYDIGVPGPGTFCANGVVVSNSIPSRMTIGQMLETSLSLLCQKKGCLTDGTSFRKISVDEVSWELVDIGLRFNGLKRLYNGRTGEYFNAAIFQGPTHLQRLQKFVKDDEYAVGGYGPTDALTGQPLEGKNARGGLRLGEMEAWVLQSQGSMMSLTEKMMFDSDHRKQFVCRTCGTPAIHNAHQGIYRCTTCGEGADIGSVDSCKAAIVFQHEMRSANVKVTLGTRPREFEDYA